MKFHKQLFRHDPANGVYGDCHRTCYACLLDLNPEDVPHCGEGGKPSEHFHEIMERFLETRGLATVSCPFQATLEEVLHHQKYVNPNHYYLLGGQSKTGCGHTVVCLNDEIIWDPSLTDSGIVAPMEDGYYWITWIVPLFMKKQNSAEETPALSVGEGGSP